MDDINFEKFDTSKLNNDQLKLLEDFFSRRKFFDNYLTEQNINLFTCPGCGYPTLTEREGYEIWGVCNWEDDGQDDKEADEIWGGPNSELSLTENRLSIGKQLKDIAESVDGKINIDPGTILKILSAHDNGIAEILNNIPDDADLNHPLVNQYKKEGQDLLRSLVDN